MKKRNSHLWRTLILVMAMLTLPMVSGAVSNPLYPPGIGFNPLVDYTLANFSASPNIRKFVNKLPGLGASGCTKSVPAGTGTCNENNLGQYIPLALADQASYLGSDYYELGIAPYTVQMNSDLPATGTKLRGYYQKNGTDHSKQYLGVAILAHRDRPVRLKVTNELGIGVAGTLPLPVDTTIMGAGMNPSNTLYPQNRSDVHLHGGATPWISDGTPHQWFTPSGDPAGKGASFQNVPDMVNGSIVTLNNVAIPVPCIGGGTCYNATANDGIGTYYYSNEQSSRLMFYHDHAVGITRLNVYDGVAAPYLLTDNFEEDIILGANTSGANPTNAKLLPNLGGVYTYGIPLVIQDKSFVNDALTPPGAGFPAPETGYLPTQKTLATDPLWYAWVATTGGNLWFPHEYLPVENPFDPTGNTPTGRWDYGPFMIPPAAPLNLTLPSPTAIPEGFQDTAVVNGTAFPYVELPPDAIRFRILNACNDRTINLQLYKADPLRINVTHGGAGYSVSPVVTITGGTGSYTSATATVVNGIITGITVIGAQNYAAAVTPTVTITDSVGTGATAAAFVGTEVKMVDAAPNAAYPTWPRDGRDGGVPDPTMQGPPWIQIGNEGGFLAKVNVINQQPIDFEYNRQVIPFAAVSNNALLLLPAFRADVVVDLSGYKDGDTLIVYNDGPAPMPFFWPLNDYYTDDPDQTATGGAVTTPAGFGPNTRTVMQIRIKGTKTSSFDFSSPNGASLVALQAGLPKIFAAGSDKILVPQLAYNDAYPLGDPLHYAGATDHYAKSYETTYNVGGTAQTIATVLATAPGANYMTPPTVVLAGGFPAGCVSPTCIPATATAGLNPIGAVTLLTAGSGYKVPPTVHLYAPTAGGFTATASATISGGIVTNINIVDPGSNYTSLVLPLPGADCFITAAAGDPGTGATCSVMIPTANLVGHIAITNAGAGYVSQPQVFVIGGGGTGATAVARLSGDVAMTGKNLTEGFDVEYGRMDIRLGSTPNPLTPNVGNGFVVGLARYIDPPTEIINDNELILWRLAHLGVDSHAMHFHLFNLQVVNRVDWTNVIKPPYPDEIGWREVIRTNPMEDIIVAVKPYHMTLPFPIPNSSRVLDPSTLLNSTTNFYPVPPPAGIPAVPQQSNVLTDFGWEYVWHCHLLGHEENDMMRPMVFVVASAKPPVPNLAPVASAIGKVTLTWSMAATTTANAPTGFEIQRATGTLGVFGTIATIHNGTATSYVDSTVGPTTATTLYRYQMRAFNTVGSSNFSTPIRSSALTVWTNPTVTSITPANLAVLTAPATLNLTTIIGTPGSSLAGGLGTPATITKVEYYYGNTLLGTSSNAAPYTVTYPNVQAGSMALTAKVYNSQGATAVSATSNVTVSATVSPTAVIVSPVNGSIVAGTSQQFTWNNTGATLYDLWRGSTPGNTDLGEVTPGGTTATTAIATGLPTNGNPVYFRLYSLNGSTWTFNDYTYIATGTPATATMTSPVNGGHLAGASQAFTWTNTSANLYDLWRGSAPGLLDLGEVTPGGTTATTATATGLPTNGSPVYFRLYTLNGSTWTFHDYAFTAAGVAGAATMTNPLTNGSAITTTSWAFTWTNSGATLYDLWRGSAPGLTDLGEVTPGGTTTTTATATGLPATGIPVYFRLYSLVGGTWLFNDYTYTSNP